jgi:hypothetical protein
LDRDGKLNNTTEYLELPPSHDYYEVAAASSCLSGSLLSQVDFSLIASDPFPFICSAMLTISSEHPEYSRFKALS